MSDDGVRGRIDFLKTFGWNFVQIEPKMPKPKPKQQQYFKYRNFSIMCPDIKKCELKDGEWITV